MIIYTFIVFSTCMLPFIIQGCSTTTPIFSSRDNLGTVVIEKPPIRIILSGEYTDIDTNNLIKVMKELRKHKYHNYNFDDTIIIDSEHATMHKDEYNTIRKNKRK